MTTSHTMEVPTEDGRKCYIEFEQEMDEHWWTVHISDELILQAPEGLTAALDVAILQMKAFITAQRDGEGAQWDKECAEFGCSDALSEPTADKSDTP